MDEQLYSSEGAPPRCPECGLNEVVRVLRSPVSLTAFRALCVTCGHRFRVSRSVYGKLRKPELDDAHVKSADRVQYMFHTDMTAGQICVTLGVALVGVAVAIWSGKSLCVLLAIFVGWWIGRAVFPGSHQIRRRALDERRCPQCNYSMRGHADGQRCPECGAPFEANRISAGED